MTLISFEHRSRDSAKYSPYHFLLLGTLEESIFARLSCSYVRGYLPEF